MRGFQNCLVLLCLTAASRSFAGMYNPDRNIGDVVPAWSNLPGTDGATHSWSDLAGMDAVVVVFTCTSCPYAVDYEDRINALADRHAGPQGRAGVVAINSNRIPEDAMPAMKARARAKGFRFTYLFDESQTVAKSFGAVRTPEFFVLDRERRIVYMGAMDDSTKPTDVKRRYVDDAIAAVLTDKRPAITETPPVGCQIRFDRRRSR